MTRKKAQYVCDKCGSSFNRRPDGHRLSLKKWGISLCSKCSSKAKGEKNKGKKRSDEFCKSIKERAIKRHSVSHPKLTRECQYCKKTYEISYGRRNKNKFCSKSCSDKVNLVKNHSKDSRVLQICEICSKEFKSYSERRTCSKKCFAKIMEKERLGENNPNWKNNEELSQSICPTCNKKFSYVRNGVHKNAKKIFCSLGCRRKINTRTNTEVLRKQQYPKEYRYIRDEILEEYSHSCFFCGTKEKPDDINTRPEVHHIDYDRKNNQKENLICLCKRCHTMAHYNRTFWENVFTGLSSNSKVVRKGWGFEIHLVNHHKYCLKYLVFYKGKRFSLHEHLLKKELWFCLNGEFECFLEEEDGSQDYFKFKKGDKLEIAPRLKHQLLALKNSILIEVSTEDFPEDSIRTEKGD